MDNLVPLHSFTQVGNVIMIVLFGTAMLLGFSGCLNIIQPTEKTQKGHRLPVCSCNAHFFGRFWLDLLVSLPGLPASAVGITAKSRRISQQAAAGDEPGRRIWPAAL